VNPAIQPVTQIIPKHLLPFAATQDSTLYSAIDHESWRYILRVSKAFFTTHAHQKYLGGLELTGIFAERIPLISEMDSHLQKLGWRAVPVIGFIPPAVFMEFLALGILPIACDMRKLENLAYTPAPDIVHEAAGHAPILADPHYAAYLKHYGEITWKAIYSLEDSKVYEAIFNLSVVKEDPASTTDQISQAQKQFEQVQAAVSYVSEAACLARMGWWTFEYGLIGDFHNPKIYGAGLLSSVSESHYCLRSEVKKVPFSIECIHTAYDITRPQPQLFVSPDFETLIRTLDKLASTMAYKKGGIEGLEKAKKAQTITTTIFESGIQISGILVEILKDPSGDPCYLKYQGPVQLSYDYKEIPNQGTRHHKEGFSTPVGFIKEMGKPPSDLSQSELENLGFKQNQKALLEFASGITVLGVLKSHIQKNGKNILLSFVDCTVKRGDQILFKPEWGTFDCACGSKVVSVFGNAADRTSYLESTGDLNLKIKTQKSNRTPKNSALEKLYAKLRTIRESHEVSLNELNPIHIELEKSFPNDWLLRLSLLELSFTYKLKSPWETAVHKKLLEIAKTSTDKNEMITRGLELL